MGWLGAVLLALAPRAFGQALPDLGGAADAPITPQVERRIGESVVRDIRSRDPAYLDDPEIEDYLGALGSRLAQANPGARQDFEFFVLRDSTINAFALPGGFVGVHTGLIAMAETESELASVLGHEIAHVTQRHVARMIGAQKQMQLPSMIALAAAILIGRSRPDLAGGAAAAAQAGAVQQQLSYTRDYEREADRVGFQTLAGAGFDVHAMPTFFEKLQRQMRATDDGLMPAYLRTHPMTADRIADTSSRAAAAPYRQHLDSLEFHLVRAKLRAESGEPLSAVAYFSSAIRDRRYASEAAARYGLIAAQLRAQKPREAQSGLAALRAKGASSPMIEALAARVQLAAGDTAGALATLRQGLQRFPDWLPLTYDLAQVLRQSGRAEEALAAIAEPLRLHPRDLRLRTHQAQNYAALGKRLQQHQAQAEVYVLRGSLPAAVEQLQLAQAAGDGNFYELSVVEARLKELRALHLQELRDLKK